MLGVVCGTAHALCAMTWAHASWAYVGTPDTEYAGLLLVEGGASGAPSDTSATQGVDRDLMRERQEQWLYVSLPTFGNFTLQEVLEEGTEGWQAFQTIGKPLDEFEPVPMHAPIASTSNNAIVVYMLPEHCLGDFNDDGSVDAQDSPYFMAAYMRLDLAADLNRNGFVEVFDQLTFVQLLTVGCVTAW